MPKSEVSDGGDWDCSYYGHMVRPDTGSFNRLLTSLGLVCLAAALVVPYFYFRGTEVLRTTSREFSDLTPTARDALVGRQSGIAALETWVLVLAVVLAILGVVLVVAGAFRLKKAQDSEDEEAELRKARARAEIRGLTPEEEERKATAEAEHESEEEGGDDNGELPGTSGSLLEPSPVVSSDAKEPELPIEASPQQRAEPPRVIVTRQVILRVEKRVNEVFQDAELGKFEFKPNLGIRSEVGRIEIDGLFMTPDSKQADVVLELKVLRSGRAVIRNARNRAEQALATAARFNSIAVDHAAIWLVMVVAAEAREEVVESDLLKAEELSGQFMLDRGTSTVIREEDLDLLPAHFLRLKEAGRFEAGFI
jgi:hypothetical protein